MTHSTAAPAFSRLGPALVLVALAVALVHGGALQNGFYYDDEPQIINGQLNRSWSSVPVLFAVENWRNVTGEARATAAPIDTYRPLYMISFVVDYQLFGLRPAGYHAVNLLWHLGCALLLLLVARRLLSPVPALFAALLFAWHPMGISPVHYVSARPDAAITFFALLALLLALGAVARNGRGNIWRYAGVGLAYLLALLWKESALLLCAAVPAVVWAARPHVRRRDAAGLAGSMLAGLGVYLSLRLYALGGMAAVQDSGHALAIVVNFPRAAVLWLLAAGFQFVPLPLRSFDPLVAPFSAIAFGLAAVFYVALGAALLFGLWQRRLWAGLGLWVVLGLAPPVVAMVRTGAIDGYYFYLTVPALALLLGAGFSRLAQWPIRRGLVVGLAAAVLLGAGLISLSAARHFRDAESFYLGIIDAGPHRSSAEYNLAGHLRDVGRYDEAVALYRLLLTHQPHNPALYNNLAGALQQGGHLQQALPHAREAVRLAPGNATYWFNYAFLALQAGDAALARPALLRALEIAPQLVPAQRLYAHYFGNGGGDASGISEQHAPNGSGP
ncbi:MAG: tetratricopeptide repeat protein [Proteobacteria bacterium]|nr:tetratricopeptide repeat protein [Pseudomonadota bacterium]